MRTALKKSDWSESCQVEIPKEILCFKYAPPDLSEENEFDVRYDVRSSLNNERTRNLELRRYRTRRLLKDLQPSKEDKTGAMLLPISDSSERPEIIIKPSLDRCLLRRFHRRRGRLGLGVGLGLRGEDVEADGRQVVVQRLQLDRVLRHVPRLHAPPRPPLGEDLENAHAEGSHCNKTLHA